MSQRHAALFLDIYGEDNGTENDNADEDNLEEDEDLEEGDVDEEDEEVTVESLKSELEAERKAKAKLDRRMRSADRRAAAAERKLADITDADQNALAEANAEIERLKGVVDSLKGEDTKTLIREEFRDTAKVQWHDPKLAFELLDLNEIDVEDGKVDADSLADAIDELVKARPYLVKGAQSDSEDDEDEEEEKPNKRRSGNHSGRNNRDKRKQVIGAKYPILANRI